MTVKNVSSTKLGSWSTKRSSTTKRISVLTTMALVGVAGSSTGVMISMVKILSLKYQVTIEAKYHADMATHVITLRTIVVTINKFHQCHFQVPLH